MSNIIYPVAATDKVVPFKSYLVFVRGYGWTDGMFRTDEPKGWCHKYASEFFFEPYRRVTHFMEMPPDPAIMPLIIPESAAPACAPATQTIPDGTKVKFQLKDIPFSEFDFLDEQTAEVLKEVDGCTATVLCLATATELGEKDFEYYDIGFTGGLTLHAISGYHLEPL